MLTAIPARDVTRLEYQQEQSSNLPTSRDLRTMECDGAQI